MNKKLLVVGAVVLAALSIFAISLNFTDKKADNNTGTSNTNKKSQKENKTLDAQKLKNLQAMLGQAVHNATLQQSPYPASTKAGWAEFVVLVDDQSTLIDPYTMHYYSYATKQVTPDYGQMQYAPGSTCDSKGEKFAEGNLRQIALRSRFSTGVKCVSSVVIQNEDTTQ
jgi:hypothetical protein